MKISVVRFASLAWWMPLLVGSVLGFGLFVWLIFLPLLRYGPDLGEALIVFVFGTFVSVAMGFFVIGAPLSLPIAAIIGYRKNAEQVLGQTRICKACNKRAASVETEWHYGKLLASGGWGSLLGARYSWAQYRVLGHVVDYFCGRCTFRRVAFHLSYSAIPLLLAATLMWQSPAAVLASSAMAVAWASIYIGSAVSTAIVAARFAFSPAVMIAASLHMFFGFMVVMGTLSSEFRVSSMQYFTVGSAGLAVLMIWMVCLNYHEVTSSWAIHLGRRDKSSSARPLRETTSWTHGEYLDLEKKRQN